MTPQKVISRANDRCAYFALCINYISGHAEIASSYLRLSCARLITNACRAEGDQSCRHSRVIIHSPPIAPAALVYSDSLDRCLMRSRAVAGLTADCGVLQRYQLFECSFFIHRSFFRTLIRRREAADSRDCASVCREMRVVCLMKSI